MSLRFNGKHIFLVSFCQLYIRLPDMLLPIVYPFFSTKVGVFEKVRWFDKLHQHNNISNNIKNNGNKSNTTRYNNKINSNNDNYSYICNININNNSNNNNNNFFHNTCKCWSNSNDNNSSSSNNNNNHSKNSSNNIPTHGNSLPLHNGPKDLSTLSPLSWCFRQPGDYWNFSFSGAGRQGGKVDFLPNMV